MNVKTLKRFSKRLVSMLLSVLMVLSLFTVCMVGSSITAGAIVDHAPNTKIRVHLNGTAAQSWEHVYFVIGRDSEGYYDGQSRSKYTSFYQMTQAKDSNNQPIPDTYELDFDGWDYWDQCFFAGTNMGYGTGGEYRIYSDVYNPMNAALKSKQKWGSDSVFYKDGNLLNPLELEIEAEQKESIDYTTSESITAHKTASTKKWGKTGTEIDSEHPDANSGYEKIYLVIGNNINVQPGATTSVYEMLKQTDGTYKTPSGFSFTGAAYYFFTTIDPSSYAGSGKKIDDAYNYVTDSSRNPNGDKVTNKFTTKLTDLELVVSNKTFIDATLYNYRSSETGGTDNDGQIPATAQTTDADNYTWDTKTDYSTGDETDYTHFMPYNKAVDAWFNGGTYTPLYAGNFRDTKYNNSVQGAVDYMGLRNFVYIANVAEHGNSHSVAVGLVDDKLHGGTITQGNGGKELPQFSDAFIEANPTLQSKYEGLKFQVNANKHMGTGNTWYSYNSSTDGNRYLDVPSKKLVEGPNINNQFFPFDPSNDGNLVKCFGLKFEVEFVMPDGGIANGEKLQFNFTGDDDLWVYIDDELVLDMGGAHGAVKGSIDLSHNTSDHPNTTHPNITGTVQSDSYNNTTIANMNGSHQYETNWSASHWNNSTWVTNRVRTITGDAATKIQDTTKTHKMTIFYMERGLYDSNLSFNFMLPLANTLSLNQEVDNKDVNQGLKRATMDVATKDVFKTAIQAQNMAEAADNIQKYPIDEDFTRQSPSGSTTYTLQEAGSGTKTTSKNIASGNGSGGPGYTGTTAAYAWTDESKLIDEAGNYTDTNAAANKGVGLPLTDAGYIPLLYGQTATFFDQFFTTGVNIDNNPNIKFFEDEYVHKFDTSYAISDPNNPNDPDDPYRIAKMHDVIRFDGQNNKPKRAVSTYYETTFTVKDGHGASLIKPGTAGQEFPYYNKDGSTNKVDAYIDYKHVILVGGISVKKEIDDSITTETTPNKDKEYKFKAEYIELFGDLDNTYDTNKDDDSKWTTMQRVKYTLTKKDGTPEPNKTIPYEGTDAGIFTLKEGETATITGIPVGTVVRVKELIEDDAEYEVKDITDGSGNKPSSTTKVVEKPMFITEGIKDNTTYSYIIKNGLAMQTASLVINTKVTTTDVNSGIATELEKIFNNDVFGYNVRSSSKKVSTNSAKLPITSAFTRKKGDGTTSDTLQTANTGSGTKGNEGSTTLPNLKGMDAYYKWTDTSGRATGSGVGVPLIGEYGDANVHLQYDQTATFDSQIALDKASTIRDVYVEVTQAPNTYTNGSNSATTGMRAANIDNSRTVASLYTTSYDITGAANKSGSRAYPKLAQDVGANENVVIEYTFTNAVKLGQIKVSKTVTDGSDANINPNGSYEFTLTYTKLFGKDVSETPAKGWEGTSSTGDTIITDEYGKFSIKKDETITFSGVPVQTDYKVTEVIPTGAKYAVKGATLTDKNSTDISSEHLTRSSNACTVTGSLVNVDDISKLTVDNTYSTVPVLYRYHNRVNTNGVPTSLQGAEEWTYFVKYVDGAVSTFINSGNITEAAKTAAISAFGTVAIDNVLATYSLGTGADFNSNYTLKELLPEELAGTIADDTAASVGYKASVQALNTNGNFYEGNKVILATIKNSPRLYEVTATYHKATPYQSGAKTNDIAKAGSSSTVTETAYVQYNQLATTGWDTEAQAQTAIANGDAATDNGKFATRLLVNDATPTGSNITGSAQVFLYWERMIPNPDGTDSDNWVPVSTNYRYTYKIVNDTKLRATYRPYANSSTATWSSPPLPNAEVVASPAYEKLTKKTYTIFWELPAGSTVKKYKQHSTGNYTIDAATATAALEQAKNSLSPQPLIDADLEYTEVIEYLPEYKLESNDSTWLNNVPKTSDTDTTSRGARVGASGYDATATDKIVNPYVKQVGSTAQNRAVFDIVFGAVGSADSDEAIENVGYILFYGNNYIDLEDYIEQKEDIDDVDSYLKSIANGAAVGTKNLINASLYPGSGKCRVAKYTAKTSGTPGTNEIRLTNKNRVDLIIDVINDDSSRKKFYTCYTYMIRDGKTYISDAPITFSPSEITLGSGGVTPTVETAYNLEIENYYQKNDGAYTVGDKNYTKANTYGHALSNAYTFANGKTLTFTIRPLQPESEIYKGKLVKLMAGSNEITPITSVEDGGQISYTFNKDHIPEADGNTLKLKAYFDPTLVGAQFSLDATEGIEYNVYFDGVKQEQYTVTTKNKDIAVPFGTTVRVEAQTVLTNGFEGYAITDAGSFTLADDASRSKSQMATKEVTVTDGMTSEQLQAAIGTQPTATPLFYTVTVQQARGTYGATLNYIGGASASATTKTAQTTTVGTTVPNSSTVYVWQADPVITLSNTSGDYVLTAGTNTSVSGNTITVTDDTAVFTIGGFATLTLSPVLNATTVATVNGNDTTIDAADTPVTVPYNYDETTGTDVTVTVTSDTSNDYYIGARNGYSNTSTSVASKTATLHSSITDLNSGLKPLPTTVKGYALTVTAGTGGQVTIQWAATINGDINGETVLAGESKEYVLVQGSLLTMYATPASGYNFGNWNNDTSLTSTSVQVDSVGSSLSYTANFDEIMYTLTVSAGTGGTVSNVAIGGTNASYVTDNNDGTYTVGATKASGVTFTLTAAPNDSYGFTNWTNAGGTVLNTSNPYTITGLSGDTTVTANFAAGILVTLDTSQSLSGGDKWSTGDPSLYVRYSKSDDSDSHYKIMTKDSTDHYSVLVPNGYTKVIFIRSNNGNEPDSNWTNVSKQAPTGDNRYTISQTNKDWVIVDWDKAIKKGPTTITLSGTSTIASGTERWALIYKNATTDWQWVDMTASGSNYVAEIPNGYDKFAICRMNGSTSTNNFDNRWNYSSDLSINYVTYATSGGTTVTVTGWGSNPLINVTQS